METAAAAQPIEPDNAVLCFCGREAARERVKKYGPTQGQYFWTCATPRHAPGHCNFFRWLDEHEGRRLSYKGRRIVRHSRYRIDWRRRQ